MTDVQAFGPIGTPEGIDQLVDLIRKHLTDDLLRAEWLERRLQGGKPTTGHCATAASAFWWLAGGRDAGWRQRNLPARVWDQGPHYFVVHVSGLIVDPTADQFDVPVPYDRAEGRGPPTSGGPIPKSARTLAARVQADPDGPALIEAARQWAFEHLDDHATGSTIRSDFVVRAATVRYRELADFVLIDEVPDVLHRSILKFAGRQGIEPVDIHDDAIAFQYRDAPAILQFVELGGHRVVREPEAHAAVAVASGPGLVTAKRQELEPADDQGARTIDAVVRRFLKKIRATDVHCRRFGPVQYTWRHDQGVEYGDTGSDVRWLLRVTGPQMYLECHDVKPFSRVLQKPFTVQGLERAYRELVDDMDVDAGVP
jgi:hypothetical protein